MVGPAATDGRAAAVCSIAVQYSSVALRGEPVWTSMQSNDGCQAQLRVALLIRVAFLCYGVVHDYLFSLRYTDVDYSVFSEGARLLWSGQSPYLCKEYRYTPLIGLLLQPNIFLFKIFGKFLFLLADCMCGCLIYAIVRERSQYSTSIFAANLWFLNPIAIIVSTRGSSESLVALFVLLPLYFLLKGQVMQSSAFLGLAIHLKLYPVIYIPSMMLFIAASQQPENCSQSKIRRLIGKLFSKQCLMFLGVCGGVVAMLTVIMYTAYGSPFLDATLKYHITRKDEKHNFSLYFYPLYLLNGTATATLLSLAAFVPQGALILATACVYFKDLPFCMLLQVPLDCCWYIL